MRLMLTVFALLLSASPARAGEPTRYLDVVNRAHDSVVALAVAPANREEFRVLPLASALRGGGDSITVEIDGGECRQDLRVEYRDGRAVVYRNVDVCRHGRLLLGKPPRHGAQPQLADHRNP